MTKAQATRMLKTEKEIVCLDPTSYISFLCYARELVGRGIEVKATIREAKAS